MYAEERQQAIAALIGQRGRVSVIELAEQFEVTTETVRRDLAALDRLGLVRRVHGGAVPAAALTAIELGTGEREHTRAAEKDRIAKAALAFLPSTGGSVLFDAGTTTARIAAQLPADRELVAVTNSLPIATRLSGSAGVRLHLLGGRVRGVTQAAVGADTLRMVGELRVDVAFIGTNALTVGHGLSTPDPDEAAVKRAMVASAHRVVVVADSTKIGREDLVRFAAIADIDVLVSDEQLLPAVRNELSEFGIEVVTA
ncbi:DeoR/GlpR family DNA-binding transcription regulator [Nocardia seriolae]|uniref:Lactose phosphotransferase system repressor n=1 Tax=Nocardia seriolae TaxID=37332 RepID=A0A0B8NCC0_9NOCA|nr:DeoR/GlpR family DNA-binding transcription regulator [Nocardia seriolae]APA95820.1 Glycerol-3-phosphate regulon repressor [Nocardia seriolae]MTJ66068.1 DeoR family transcriptional regulator [Nocardia seriolae]MTJ75072.1 DeoR family transcriptional regulator [Nocardia seriolae]MTJ86013.1 DeoR family transcriptional regulator [Nocardia seriolae]MTK30009.1 DeoR family transcriptional regulator [Nocardia seriolae]